MNQTYRPSGKISFFFVPAFAVMLLMTAAGTFVCAFCIWFSPYTVIDAVIFIIFTVFMAKYGALLCIKCGKVRNPFLSGIAGLILAVWYWYLLIVSYLPVKEIFTMESFHLPKENLMLTFRIFQPSKLWEAILALRNEGAAFTGKTGNTLFVIPGTVCIIFLSIAFLVTTLSFALTYRSRSRYPFCESSGKWAKEIVLTRSIPEDEELFLSKLFLGDTKVLSGLKPLNEVNVDHYQISLFVTGRKENFYVSISKMENSGKPDRHTGKTEFEENELTKYLATDRATGLSLLSRGPDRPEDAAVRVVTDETEKKDRRRLAIAWICGILQLLIVGTVILKMEHTAEFLLKGGFFYILIVFLSSIVQFVRSFQKETVIVSTEERFEYDGIKKHLGTEKEIPLGYKLYYLFLMISAVALFTLCICRM